MAKPFDVWLHHDNVEVSNEQCMSRTKKLHVNALFIPQLQFNLSNCRDKYLGTFLLINVKLTFLPLYFMNRKVLSSLSLCSRHLESLIF